MDAKSYQKETCAVYILYHPNDLSLSTCELVSIVLQQEKKKNPLIIDCYHGKTLQLCNPDLQHRHSCAN